MSGQWRALRRRLLTPDLSEASFDKRGFRAHDLASQTQLETVGRTFLAGFGFAAEATGPAHAQRLLDTVDKPLRGFAYEGAAMCFAILDAIGLRGGRIREFLAGGGRQHVYMVHVGMGWALARLPRPLWRRALPADPLLGWLALDGYGFHQAYFHTERYVRRQYQDPSFAWPLDARQAAAHRVIDQGIGRALWFVEGADVDRLATTIEGFAPARHADLFAGAGLAATYAGGVGRTELESLRRRAGRYVPQLAQGSAFGAEARLLAGLTTSHTALATDVLCGMTPQRAAAVTDAARIDLTDGGPAPDYEIWRQRIATQFASSGRY